MTGKLDKRMRALGQRLVDAYGKPVTLRRTTSTYDPATGTTSTSTTNYSVNGVLEGYEDSRIDGTVVQAGDLRVTIPAQNLAIAPSMETDALVIGSGTWTLVNVRPTYSGEQVAIYELQVRQ